MTEHEENAREIISNSMTMNTTILEASSICISSGNAVPVLTDSECKAISVNYPFPWQEIRDCFNRI